MRDRRHQRLADDRIGPSTVPALLTDHEGWRGGRRDGRRLPEYDPAGGDDQEGMGGHGDQQPTQRAGRPTARDEWLRMSHGRQISRADMDSTLPPHG